MNSKIKKILAVLLSAVVVMSLAFISTAADPRYERPELNKADTVKTTGTWSKDANGFWSLTSDNTKVSGGWYYANMVNSSTEYRWYHFDEKGIMSTGWVKDRLDPSIWYYTGEAKDATEGSMATGWVTDPQDGQKYYMDPATGQMSHGWVKIDNAWYYFTESQYANRSWTPDQTGYWTASKQTGHSFGSMYKNEMTPDGYYVDGTGAWRQSSGNSSSRKKPTPVMAATASTTTPQHAGEAFNTDGLTITVFKDGAVYKTVPHDDPSIVSLNVTVVGTTDNLLVAGANDIEISFVYYDPDVIIGQSMTAEVFTVDGLTYTVTFDANGHGTAPAPISGVTYRSTITAPATPTEVNYAFGGWYKETGCTNAWDFDNDTVTENTTLYAKWTPVTFTVEGGRTVKFSPGLMYWDGNSFEFESSQTEFSSKWNANHVNHFFWSASPSVAVAGTYSDSGASVSDIFFTNADETTAKSDFTVNGETGVWRTLSWSEWDYLINTRKINGGTTSGYGKTCKWGTYSGVNGLIIAHDNYTGDFSNAAAAVEDGCVFLPAAGYRNGTYVFNIGGDFGYYWSSTPNGDSSACYLFFSGGGVGTYYYRDRNYGHCVRLVK